MPTYQMSEERREEIRRQEWEDREYWTVQEQAKHERLMQLTQLKLVEAGKVKVEATKLNDRRSRLIVKCITLLSLFGRPVPQILEDLLDK